MSFFEFFRLKKQEKNVKETYPPFRPHDLPKHLQGTLIRCPIVRAHVVALRLVPDRRRDGARLQDEEVATVRNQLAPQSVTRGLERVLGGGVRPDEGRRELARRRGDLDDGPRVGYREGGGREAGEGREGGGKGRRRRRRRRRRGVFAACVDSRLPLLLGPLPSPGAQKRREGLRHAAGPEEVDLHLPPDLRKGLVEQGARDGDPRAVDQSRQERRVARRPLPPAADGLGGLAAASDATASASASAPAAAAAEKAQGQGAASVLSAGGGAASEEGGDGLSLALASSSAAAGFPLLLLLLLLLVLRLPPLLLSFFLASFEPALPALPLDQRLPDKLRGSVDGPLVADVHLDGGEPRRAQLGDEGLGVLQPADAAKDEKAAAGELGRGRGPDAGGGPRDDDCGGRDVPEGRAGDRGRGARLFLVFWCGGSEGGLFWSTGFFLAKRGGHSRGRKNRGRKRVSFLSLFLLFSLWDRSREIQRRSKTHTSLTLDAVIVERRSGIFFKERKRGRERERGRKGDEKEKKCDFGFSFSFFFDSHLFTLSLLLSPPLLHSPSSTRNSSPSLSPRITAATSRTLAPLRWSATTPLEKL